MTAFAAGGPSGATYIYNWRVVSGPMTLQRNLGRIATFSSNAVTQDGTAVIECSVNAGTQMASARFTLVVTDVAATTQPTTQSTMPGQTTPPTTPPTTMRQRLSGSIVGPLTIEEGRLEHYSYSLSGGEGAITQEWSLLNGGDLVTLAGDIAASTIAVHARSTAGGRRVTLRCRIFRNIDGRQRNVLLRQEIQITGRVTTTPGTIIPELRFGTASVSLGTGDSNSAYSAIVLPSHALPAELTINFEVTGTLDHNVDYRDIPAPNNNGTFTMPINAVNGRIRFQLLSLSSADNNEYLQLKLLPGTGYTVGNNNTHRLTYFSGVITTRPPDTDPPDGGGTTRRTTASGTGTTESTVSTAPTPQSTTAALTTNVTVITVPKETEMTTPTPTPSTAPTTFNLRPALQAQYDAVINRLVEARAERRSATSQAERNRLDDEIEDLVAEGRRLSCILFGTQCL